MTKRLSISEVAELTGLSKAWWYKKVCQRAVPFEKIGTRILFNPDAIEKYFAERAIEPAATVKR